MFEKTKNWWNVEIEGNKVEYPNRETAAVFMALLGAICSLSLLGVALFGPRVELFKIVFNVLALSAIGSYSIAVFILILSMKTKSPKED